MDEDINFFLERVLHVTEEDIKGIVRARYFDFSEHQVRMFKKMTRFGRLSAMAEIVEMLFQTEVRSGYVDKHVLNAIDPRCFHSYQGMSIWAILEMYLYRRINHLLKCDTIDQSIDKYNSNDEDTDLSGDDAK